MKQKAETHRIEIGGSGLGEASEEAIRNRAAEIAQQDGRVDSNEQDWETALRELRSPANDRSDEWQVKESERPGSGVPSVSLGSRSTVIEPEDEESVAEQLTREGVEEAEHEIRTEAAKQQDTSDADLRD